MTLLWIPLLSNGKSHESGVGGFDEHVFDYIYILYNLYFINLYYIKHHKVFGSTRLFVPCQVASNTSSIFYIYFESVMSHDASYIIILKMKHIWPCINNRTILSAPWGNGRWFIYLFRCVCLLFVEKMKIGESKWSIGFLNFAIRLANYLWWNKP